MTSQSGGGGLQATQTVGGVLSGLLTAPAFATNGTTPILGLVSSFLGADVAMTNASQFYDGPSVSLTIGTWLLFGQVVLLIGGSNSHMNAKLWDGTTVLASGQVTQVLGTNWVVQIALSASVVVAAPTTLKISGACSSTGGAIRSTTTVLAAGNTASGLTALRVV